MKNDKPIFSTELAYGFGLVLLALGTALMEGAGFGVSMVVAPAYILHLKLSALLPFFSFGLAEYALQAVLLLALVIVMRRFRLSYLFSFVTTILYGLVLDGFIFLLGFVPHEALFVRILFYCVGMVTCSLGVSMFFHTYVSPAVYELFVKEVSGRMGVNIHRFKTVYDCTSCLVGILMSFAFFGLWQFEGIHVGTVVCALLNGVIIGFCTKILDRFWRFEDRLPLRRFFE